jgi:hypothetical protein
VDINGIYTIDSRVKVMDKLVVKIDLVENYTDKEKAQIIKNVKYAIDAYAYHMLPEYSGFSIGFEKDDEGIDDSIDHLDE